MDMEYVSLYIPCGERRSRFVHKCVHYISASGAFVPLFLNRDIYGRFSSGASKEWDIWSRFLKQNFTLFT